MILVIVPAAIVAGLSLASFAGRWVWWLDVLANFRAQYVVVLAVLGAIVVLSRWRKTGAGILAVALLNLVFVAPLYIGSPGDSDPTAPAMTVMSFNLLSSNESYGEVIEFIESEDPDLVFLYEASRPWEVAMESSGLGYEVIRGRSEELIFGTLVMARDPVEVVSYGFAEAQPRSMSLVYQPEGWPESMEILSTHPLAPTTEVRASLRDAQLEFAAAWAARSPRCVRGGRRPQRDSLVLSISGPGRRREASQLADRLRDPAQLLGRLQRAAPGPHRSPASQ